VTCDACQGSRFLHDTLAVKFRGRSIAEVLEIRVDAALELFAGVPKIRRILQTLVDVGLGYVALGQAAPTLSGGEAQRVKLAAELGRPDTGRTLYVLDEPTTGLHADDVRKLLNVLHRLADLGNTVVLIEHNLEVMKTADWIVDLGPEAGSEGGSLVGLGPPEAIAALDVSHTGRFLTPILAAGPRAERARFDPQAALREALEAEQSARNLVTQELGKGAQMPWQIDGRRWHTRDRVTRTGKPVRWDGAALELVVDRIAKLGGLPPADWSARSAVRIPALDPDLPCFFEAMTGQEWVLTLRFRVPSGTCKPLALAKQLALPSFNEASPPVPSEASRVEVLTLPRRNRQEITITVHAVSDLETSGFGAFLESVVRAASGASGADAWSGARQRLEALIKNPRG
jgi:excinuclease ABC subunit A